MPKLAFKNEKKKNVLYISTDLLSLFTDPQILLILCYHNFPDLQGSLDVLEVHYLQGLLSVLKETGRERQSLAYKIKFTFRPKKIPTTVQFRVQLIAQYSDG